MINALKNKKSLKRAVGLGAICALITFVLLGYQNCNKVSLLNEGSSIQMSEADIIDLNYQQSYCDDSFAPVSIQLSDRNMDELGLNNIDYNTTSLEFYCKRKKPVKDRQYTSCLDMVLDESGQPDFFDERRLYALVYKNNIPIYTLLSYILFSRKNYEFSMFASVIRNNDNRRIYLDDYKTTIKFSNRCAN